ncbi:MAG: OmpA family protein, partial [Bacteroidales bacterium]|nr:OmpA family protein [Bacteroidales bacterium]
YNEETPFFTENENKIYFSSQGHATMGGYDIFVSERLPGALWSFPENLGYPISSADDDLFYVPRSNGWRGYFSTMTDSMDGGPNIYALRIVPTDDVRITMRTQGDSIDVETVQTNITHPITGREIQDEKEPVPDAGEEASLDTTATKRIVPGPVEADEYFILNSLMFDFDSDSLSENAKKEADRVYEVLRKNPGLELELTGHTDAVGSDEYNLRLSNHRAQSVATYLERKGIDADRLFVAGIGESNPIALNVYEDGTDSPDGRRLNRHVSLKLRNLQDQQIEITEIFVPDELKPRSETAYTILLIESESILDTIPVEVCDEPVALVITEESFLYTAGNFEQKPNAMKYLNEVIDRGYE